MLTNDKRHLIDIAIVYSDNKDKVYQWLIDDFPVEVFVSENEEFWLDIIAYAENHLADASVVNVSHVVYEDPVDITQMRSSAGADLMEDMADLLEPEYFGRRKYTTYVNGEKSKFYNLLIFASMKQIHFRGVTR